MKAGADEVDEWMNAVADVIAGRSVFWEITDGWAPASGSHAEWEQREVLATGWGDGESAVRVQGALLDWWDAADGFLDTLETLFRTGHVTHAVPYVSRAVLEHAHKICWLLQATEEKASGSNPVTLADRAARVYLEELFSLRHCRDVVEKLPESDPAAVRQTRSEYKEMKALITRLFGDPRLIDPDVQLEGGPSQWSLNGQRWRGPTWLAEWYAKTKGGGSDGAYDALSAMSHPTLYGIREFISYEDVPEGVRRRRTVSEDFLVRVAAGAVVTHWRACVDLASYFGWDRSELNRWGGAINLWHPGSIADL